MLNVKRLESTDKNVWKYVFMNGEVVYEAVLYRYNDFNERTVICCSVQSGCPVGCLFCGTGSKFIRNLTSGEIVHQVLHILADQGINPNDVERLQVMFMSMGEPMLNWLNVSQAISGLRHTSLVKVELLISTVGIDDYNANCDMTWLSKSVPHVGLQFSIHRSTNEERDKLIPYKNKMTLEQIRDCGIYWQQEVGRKPYLNYCVDGTNASQEDFERLYQLFSPGVFNFTFSVVCSKDETMKDAGYRELGAIREFEKYFIDAGYDTRIFDPAGQDDIGGGCGMLWHFQRESS